MLFGAILVFLGVVYLLDNLGILNINQNFWNILWPIVLIVIGIYILEGSAKFRKIKNNRYYRRFFENNRF